MAQTATTRRNGHTARRRPASTRRREPVRAVEKAKQAKAAPPSSPSLVRLTGSVGRKAVKKLAGKLADSGADTIRLGSARAAATAGRAVSSGKSALESSHRAIELGKHRRLPIQCSIDIAVPLRFAWEEWMSFGFLPEGMHRVEQIERDRDGLVGRTVGTRTSC